LKDKKKILIVETDKRFIEKLRIYLESMGVEVTILNDGKEALNLISEIDFDAIITEIVTPRVDGLKMASKMDKEIPVIVVSGIYRGSSIRAKALNQKNVIDFLEKPFNMEQIKESLEEKANVSLEEEEESLDIEVIEEDVSGEGKVSEEEIKDEKSKEDEETLSSDELFGDIIDEVNKNEEEKDEDKSEENKKEVQDKQVEKKKADKDKIKKEKEVKKKRFKSQADDIDSLITGIVKEEKEENKKDEDRENEEIDELIDKTLVDLRMRRKKRKRMEESEKEKEVKKDEIKSKESEVKEKKETKAEKEKVTHKEKEKAKEKEKSKEEEKKEKKDEEKKEKPSSGDRIVATGKYELLEKIATGGMGEIYKAKQRGIGGFEKIVTIKKILPHLAEDEDFIKMFIDEAKIAVSLSHPNVVQIFDLGKMNDEFIIAMEYVPGKNLGDVLRKLRRKKEHISDELGLYVALKVARALEYAHKKKNKEGELLGIVHRDVNPHNILLSFDGEVKLTDFGISKAKVKMHQTIAGDLKGKLIYMSPEQAMGKTDITFKSDIYSMGILMYEMFTLKNPFVATSEAVIIDKVKKAEFKDPKEINPYLSEEIRRVITKCMKKEPEKRFDNTKKMRKEIEKILIKRSSNSSILKDLFSKYLSKQFPQDVEKEGFVVEDTKEIIRTKKEFTKLEEEIDDKSDFSEGKKKKDEEKIEKKKVKKTRPSIWKKPDYSEDVEGEIEVVEEDDEVRKSPKKEKISTVEEEISTAMGGRKKEIPVFLIIILIFIIAASISGFVFFKDDVSAIIGLKTANTSVETDNGKFSVSTEEKNWQLGEDKPQDIQAETKVKEKDIGEEKKFVSGDKQMPGEKLADKGSKQKPQEIMKPSKTKEEKTDPSFSIQEKQTSVQKDKSKERKREQPISKVESQEQKQDEIVKNEEEKTKSKQIKTDTNKTETTEVKEKITEETKKSEETKKQAKSEKKVEDSQDIPVKAPEIKEGSVVPIVSLDKELKIKKQVVPSFRYERVRRESIRIMVQVLVNTEGLVEDLRVINVIPKVPGAESKIKSDISKWKFSIPTKNGVKVKTWKMINMKINIKN